MMALMVLSAWSASIPAEEVSITVLDWQGYEDPSFHPAYVSTMGRSPDFVLFSDEEEALRKLKAGLRADVAHPCSQSVALWRDAGLLEPLDTSKLVHWNKLDPALRDLPGFVQDRMHFVVPFEWGNTGLVYRTDLVPAEDVASLLVFADPRYAGKVSISANVDDAYALALLAIGVKDWSDLSDQQFEAASAFLRKVHRNVRFYWIANSDISQALGSGEVEIAWAWNETPTTLQASGQPVTMNKDTEEGLSTWVCGYVILKDHPGPSDQIYHYLNAVSDPGIAGYLVEAWGYGHGNRDGMGAIDPDLLEEKSFARTDEFKAKMLFQSPLPPAMRRRMISEFDKIKAGF
ncbi:MAG TPA: extracellular solute-binding protein [Geminicoccus sp.]|uniref:extracellular solute-binding protein n=1 Tax=Geminicoccus sp. TaxID=2024832 RepID=UPI002E303F65|nr:extracellular solute-binding protein [Geminicoccus sp.]HEX2525040.1 extracellular solute-binding protein [Geminicoccus sp.]